MDVNTKWTEQVVFIYLMHHRQRGQEFKRVQNRARESMLREVLGAGKERKRTGNDVVIF